MVFFLWRPCLLDRLRKTGIFWLSDLGTSMIHFRKVVHHLLIDQGFQAIIWARDTRTFWNFPWWFSSFRLAFLLLFLSVLVMVSFIELSFLRVFFPRALGIYQGEVVNMKHPKRRYSICLFDFATLLSSASFWTMPFPIERTYQFSPSSSPSIPGLTYPKPVDFWPPQSSSPFSRCCKRRVASCSSNLDAITSLISSVPWHHRRWISVELPVFPLR